MFATREDLVGIGLMAHVPDDAVHQEIKFVKERHRQFNGAEIGAEVAAGFADGINEEIAELGGELLQLGSREMPDLLRRGDGVEEGVLGAGHAVRASK